KKTGGVRICCDYKKLNQITVSDGYPIPRQDELFAALGGQKIFAALDLKSGYYNVKIQPESQHYTAFITPWGLYEWSRMPFGLKTAPSHFQRCVNSVLRGLIGPKCLVYLDDILVFGEDEGTFVKNLQEVLHRLAEVNLLLNYDKCQIGMREVKYLGFIVNNHGRRIDPDRIQNLRDMKGPSTVKGVQKLATIIQVEGDSLGFVDKPAEL
ncbi:hypothetical protein ADUPG1_013468, partial [Aduncisulcus paluster]